MDSTGTSPAFTDLIHAALRAYDSDADLARLTLLLALPTVQALRCGQPGLSAAAAVRRVLNDGLARLAQSDCEAAELLHRRFVDGEPMAQIARAWNYSESYLFKLQRQAIPALAQIVWQAAEEDQCHVSLTEAQAHALAALPPRTFSRLFGVSCLLARLKDFLAATQSCPLVALEGMGGIGKTALARAAAEELVREGRFNRVVWITAQQQLFAWGHIQLLERPALTCEELREELYRALHLGSPAGLTQDEQEHRLRLALAQTPTLIVVDNLETAADVQALVTGLDRLTRPAKVLLTTRHRVAGHENVTSLLLRELPREDALALIHYHAWERNVPAVVNAPVETLERIFAVTDGNPLAIKLVVGQLHSRPLATVLDDLAHARPAAHEFYRFIFRYSWEHLSPAARHLLLHMPLLDARGAAGEELAAVSGVPTDAGFWAAVDELVNCSLLNAGNVGGRMRYSIHRLTENFILSDLVRLEHC